MLEGFLVGGAGEALGLVLGGVALLLCDLVAHLRSNGDVYRRIPLADSRIARFVLGWAGSGAEDHVPIGEVARRYGDLVRPGALGELPPPAAEDTALARLLGDHVGPGGRALDVGTGVGRGAFVLRGFVDRVLGIDGSLARVRRARNIAVTAADFFLPGPPGADRREVPLDLDQLDREGVDFAFADAARLPLADAAFDVVVVRAGDGRGPWPDAGRVLAEAARVLAPDGILVLDESLGDPGGALARRGGLDGFGVWGPRPAVAGPA